MYTWHIAIPTFGRDYLTEGGGAVMEDNAKEFVAYSRKLLRALEEIRTLLDKGEEERALEELGWLTEDTRKDIEV